MSTVAVVFNVSFSVLTICTVFNDSRCSVTFAICDSYSVSAVAVVFNISFSILTICTSVTFRASCTCCTCSTCCACSTCCTIFHDSGCGVTFTICDSYSMSTVAVVFNVSFSVLTICTVFNDSGCSVTFTICDSYSMSTVAVVFNVSFSILTIYTVFTIFNDSCSN